VNLRITQRFDRFLNDQNYKYSPAIFELGKIEGPESATFLGEGSDDSVFGEKSIHMHNDVYLELKPGNYFVRLRVLWNSTKYRTAVLSAYAAETVNFVRCDSDTGKQVLITQASRIGKIFCGACWPRPRKKRSFPASCMSRTG
jgi:hypothetical protein